MTAVQFTPSKDFSIGIELEYQIINPHSYNLISRAKELMRSVQNSGEELGDLVKPEITQSMLEINSSIHTSPQSLYQELMTLRKFLVEQSNKVNTFFCGGGTHPFQKWVERKIFPTHRYRNISRKYQYLSKQSTVFGQHVHIGCAHAQDALYLTHILGRFVPQLIAMSASSPFYQGVDTGFNSARLTIFNIFPMCGTMPYIHDWEQFSEFFFKMQRLGIIESMKDFYWDVRPKPEFGTVEVRVCDTPLTFKKAMLMGIYVQTLACYILREKPLKVTEDIYLLHNYNRFQAARYGFEGVIIDPFTYEKRPILQDILDTMSKLKDAAEYLGVTDCLAELHEEVVLAKNDSSLLREVLGESGNMKDVVSRQCELWMS